MVIDGHAHVYPDKVTQKIVETFTQYHHMEPTSSLGKGTVGDLLEKMEKNDVDYVVLANFAPIKGVERTNAWILSLDQKHFIPLISVYPGMDLEIVKGYFASGAKGIKMHTGIQGFEPDDEGLRLIYRYCNEKQIPITFHCGETSRVHMNEYAEMTHILPVVGKYPRIPFVLTHLAAGDPDLVLEIAQKHDNVIFDTSITMTGEHCIHRIHDNVWENDRDTVELFRKIGCHRIAFGSDYPFGNPIKDIERIKRLALDKVEKDMILGENTYRLYYGLDGAL